MADSAREQSIGALVRDATAHLSTLLRAELELARAEITAEVKKGLKGSVFFIVALAVLLFSLFFLFITVAEVIAIWLPQWAGFLIVWVLMVGVAVLFAVMGYRKVRRLHAPERTISSMRDTASALKRTRESSESSAG